MNNLVVTFSGMSLILGGVERSEALLISTKKNPSPHQHKHSLAIDQGNPMQLDEDVLLWIEVDGQRLQGPLTDAATLLARRADLTPKKMLLKNLQTSDPANERGWLDRLAIWFRLPGGELRTTPTNGPGGRSEWEFPSFDGAPVKKRQLTQNGVLTKNEVKGSVRVAILSGLRQPIYVPVPEVNGDYNIAIRTEYDGPSLPDPTPGTQVELHEMALLYRCVDGGVGPIPFVRNWPNQLLAKPGLHSDPVTGICPIAMSDV